MIPSGTVTFLFTDIEGSTKLAQDYPDKLPSALERHHFILNEAIELNNGFVFEIVGDAFCSAFENAADAVNAAVSAQSYLLKEKWDDAVIKIRAGIHSGSAAWNGNKYVGYITLARTSRIMSAAYGGQILISNVAFELAKEKISYSPREEISFIDLGERRLKDLNQPIRLHQIASSELPSDFPKLKTLDEHPNNLPVQLTSFVGREDEMKRVKDLLKQTHLLTLTGTGGAGKTRLALQVCADVIDDYADGVWVVELDSLFDSILISQTVTKILGIVENPGRTFEESLIDFLKDKEILMILDNCEHLVDACAVLTERLLSTCPKLKIISTSREALKCSGEQTYRVPSLKTPDIKEKVTPEKLTQYESVRLFIERALAVNEEFLVNNNNAPALAQICFQLDGIPLAIELASARIKVLTIEKICERLDDRVNFLTKGKRTALPRQQTLRATMDWSYDLLSEKEKILWNRLSVFSGGWTLNASEEICSDEKINKNEVMDILSDLAEKSIIIFDHVNERYRMLETIRQYGNEKLRKSCEYENISDKHLRFYMEMAEYAEMKLKGNEMVFWLNILDHESGNVEKGLTWSIEGNPANSDDGVRLAGAMGYFWKISGHISERMRWFETVLQKRPKTLNSSYCKVISEAARLAFLKSDYEKSSKFTEEGLNFYSEIGDKQGIADSINLLANIANAQGEYVKASRLYEDSLTIRRQIIDKEGIADSLNHLGNIACAQGEYVKSSKLHEESLAIRRQIEDKLGIAKSLNNLGNIAGAQGEYVKASSLYEESLSIKRQIGDKFTIASALQNLGVVASIQGENDKASNLFTESLEIRREIGNKSGIAISLNNLGSIILDQGDYVKASILIEEGLAISREIGDKLSLALLLTNMGAIHNTQGEYIKASDLLEESLAISQGIGHKLSIIYSLNNLGDTASSQGEYVKASDLFEESLAISREIGNQICTTQSLTGLGNVAFEQGNLELASKLFEENIAISKGIGIKSQIAVCSCGLGKTSFGKKEFENARKLYNESLALLRKLGSKKEITFNILRLMELQTSVTSHTPMAKLLGYIMNYFESNKIKLPKAEQIVFDELILKAKENLSEEEFSKYFEEGKLLTLEEAIELTNRKGDCE